MELNANFIANKALMTKEAVKNKGKYPNAVWMFVNQKEAKDVFSRLDPKKAMGTQELGNDIVKFMSWKWAEGNKLAINSLKLIEDFAKTFRELADLPPLKKSFLERTKQFWNDYGW